MKINKRLQIIILIITICYLILIFRLSYVKVSYSEEYLEKAIELWTRTAPVSGVRGKIYDRNGKIIVGNVLTPTVVAIPKQVKDVDKTASILANILKCSTSEIKKHLEKNVSVEILKNVGRKITIYQAKQIISEKLDGIYVVSDTKRNYPYESLLSAVVGFTGIDNQGITGLEYIYNQQLEGINGGLKIYTDAHGNSMNDITGLYEAQTPGGDIYLTVDLDIQIALERVLKNAAEKYTPEEISAIVMNPNTAEIYAMAQYPNYNPEKYQEYDQSLYNRNFPIWTSYEPGSCFKIITYSAGLEEGVFKMDDLYYDPGYIDVDGAHIKDWKKGGHGKETFLEVIENSCNPGFVTIGLRLGKEKLFEYVKKYGFGEKTGIDLLGESSGIIFDSEKIGNVELATTSFGQGISVTSIQLIRAACAAINGGNLMKPYIVKKIVKEDKIILENNPETIRKVISEETSAKMRLALEKVVSNATGRSSYIEGYRVGGKTSSAQVVVDGKYSNSVYILSFLGIAPMNNPQVAVYISVKHPKNTIQYGGTVAAPLVKEVLQECFTILRIEKQEGGYPLNPRYYIDKQTYTVEDYYGFNINKIPRNDHYNIKIEGDGPVVIGQIPEKGESIVEDGYVVLYT